MLTYCQGIITFRNKELAGFFSSFSQNSQFRRLGDDPHRLDFVYRRVTDGRPGAASVALVGVGAPQLRQIREHCRARAVGSLWWVGRALVMKKRWTSLTCPGRNPIHRKARD